MLKVLNDANYIVLVDTLTNKQKKNHSYNKINIAQQINK